MTPTDPAVDTKTAKKAKDKKQKRKRQEVEDQTDEDTQQQQQQVVLNGVTASEPDSEPKKKKKKKSQKQDIKIAEETIEEQSPEKKKNSKKKKDKNEKNGIIYKSSEKVELAQVGDVQLATTSKAIIKNVYKEHKKVAEMSEEEVLKERDLRCIAVDSPTTDSFKIITEFKYLNLSKEMLYSTRDFSSPSPIQSQCWPVILSGNDMIGVAATGSGKTLGFGIPALQHIDQQRQNGVVQGKGPFVLTIAPTRELAVQISEVLQEAGSQCDCKCVCVYGGVPKYTQTEPIKKGIEIVVGTPGRIEDLVQEGTCSLKQVTYVVLDEADRMLDMGFEPAMRSILGRTRADRQTLMFSATWPESVRKLASEFLCNPVKVQVGSKEVSAAKSVKQKVEVVEDHEKMKKLITILQQHRKNQKEMKIIIFVLYKKEAPQLENNLNNRGFEAVAVHGDASQQQRQQAVNKFKEGNVPILVATDVAARGLDIPDVQMVINYTFPLTIEDYVHRIGRTGRAGKVGSSHTFFCPKADKAKAGELMNILREAGQKVPEELLKFGTAVKKKESKVYGAHFKEVDMNQKATRKTFGDSDDDS